MMGMGGLEWLLLGISGASIFVTWLARRERDRPDADALKITPRRAKRRRAIRNSVLR